MPAVPVPVAAPTGTHLPSTYINCPGWLVLPTAWLSKSLAAEGADGGGAATGEAVPPGGVARGAAGAAVGRAVGAGAPPEPMAASKSACANKVDSIPGETMAVGNGRKYPSGEISGAAKGA